MKKIEVNQKELRRIVLETAAIIGVCALVFAGITQAAFSAVTNQTATVPAAVSMETAGKSSVPAGYVKADYTIELGQYSKQPTAKDISVEEAAERGAQDLWRVFGLDLSGKTIEMTYNEATSTHPRADWTGIVTISENHLYYFSIDAVTGENRVTQQEKYWDEGVDTGLDTSLLKDHTEFDALAQTINQKYQFVTGKVTSVEYAGQGFCTNPSGAKNATVEIQVKSENGQQAQLTFSRYNNEFLGVAYDCWVKESAAIEQQILNEQEKEKATQILIDDEKMEGAQPIGGFWIKVIEPTK